MGAISSLLSQVLEELSFNALLDRFVLEFGDESRVETNIWWLVDTMINTWTRLKERSTC